MKMAYYILIMISHFYTMLRLAGDSLVPKNHY